VCFVIPPPPLFRPLLLAPEPTNHYTEGGIDWMVRSSGC
jgi:hypothetical protein